jgi:hypothetical protein
MGARGTATFHLPAEIRGDVSDKRCAAQLVATPSVIPLDAVVRQVEVLLVISVVLYGLWWLTESTFPFATRVTRNVFRGAWRSSVRLAWRAPVRRVGTAMTLLIWCIVAAAALSVAALDNRQMSPAALVAWCGCAVLWLVARRLAQFRLRARRLPARR